MRKYFLLYIGNSATNKILKNFLVVVHIVIRNGSKNGEIHISLKYCIQNFKISLKNIVYEAHNTAYNIILIKRYTYVQNLLKKIGLL